MWDYLGNRRDDLMEKNIEPQIKIRRQDFNHRNDRKTSDRNGKYL